MNESSKQETPPLRTLHGSPQSDGSGDEYEDSPWTREELEALAWERIKDEEWDEYELFPKYQ